MSRLLYRLGRCTAAHPWRTISAWVLVAVAVAGLAAAFGGTPQDDYDIPGARAQVGIDQLRAHLPGAGNATARSSCTTAAAAASTAADPAALTDPAAARCRTSVTVCPPRRLAPTATPPWSRVEYDAPVTDPDLMGNLEPARRRPSPHARRPASRSSSAASCPSSAAAPMEGRGEMIGIVAALRHPGVRVRLRGRRRAADRAPPWSGSAVGTRGHHPARRRHGRQHRRPDGRHHGRPRRRHRLRAAARHPARRVPRAGLRRVEAAGRAVATAGRSVVFAASTVLVSLMGLRLAGLPGLQLLRLRHRDRRRRPWSPPR